MPTITPRKRLKFTALVILILGTFVFPLFGSAEGAAREQLPPEAENGLLNLGDWDLDTEGIISLKGQWEFYWQQLLEPRDFLGSPKKTGFINVPGTWNRFQTAGSDIGGKGYATYRLVVHTNSQDELLALKIPRVFTAYRLWVNGSLEASAGQVGTSFETMTPQYLPQVAVFSPKSETIEIVVQVSNYRHRSGGILESINLGLEKHIRDARSRALGLELFIVGCLLIMGLYHLSLFACRSSELSSLVFGVYCLAIGIRTTLTGEIFFIYLMPNFNWEAAHNIQTLAFYLGIPLFVMFIRLIFPNDVPIKSVRLVQVVSLSFSLLVVFTPARIFTIVNPAFQVFVLLIIPYFLYTLARAVRNRRQGALIIGIGALILILATVNDVVFLSIIMNDYPAPLLRSIVTTGNLSSWGLLIFTFAQSLVLAMKFSTAFTRVEEISAEVRELNRTLEEKVLERTADLEDSKGELEQAYQDLSRMHRFRRDLLANISHDLRSPMTAIKGYVDAILDGIVKDPAEQRQYLAVVREKTMGLDLLTRELFELARLESREAKLQLTAIKADKIIQTVCEKNQLDLNKRGIELRLAAPECPLSRVAVDMAQMERVFGNFIANAVRYTPQQGVITIGCEVSRNKTVFYVKDTGTGIKPEDLPNIFDRFYKGDKSRGAGTGSGLGLAIAKEIVEYHGGEIWAENNPGTGAAFFFSLPPAPEEH